MSSFLKGEIAPAGDMLDEGTLRFHDVVPGGVISLNIWRYDGWIELVAAAAEGDSSKVLPASFHGCPTEQQALVWMFEWGLQRKGERWGPGSPRWHTVAGASAHSGGHSSIDWLVYGLGTHSPRPPTIKAHIAWVCPLRLKVSLALVQTPELWASPALLWPCPGEQGAHSALDGSRTHCLPGLPPLGTQLTLGGRKGQRPGCLPIRKTKG